MNPYYTKMARNACNRVVRSNQLSGFRDSQEIIFESPINKSEFHGFYLGFTTKVLSFEMHDAFDNQVGEDRIKGLAKKIYRLFLSQNSGTFYFENDNFISYIFYLTKDVCVIQTKKILGAGVYKNVFDGIFIQVVMDQNTLTISKLENVALLQVFKNIRSAKMEDEMAARFDSPHIIKKSYFNFSFSKFWFMVNEKFLCDLEKVRTGNLILTFQRKVQVFTGAAKGLSIMHQGGYLHRDIKPANIAIKKDGEGILIDLGYTVHRENLEDLCGSPFYTPPEEILLIEKSDSLLPDNEKQELACDLWAFGITMHEIFHPLFQPPCFLRKAQTFDKLSRNLKKYRTTHIQRYSENLYKDWCAQNSQESKIQAIILKLLAPFPENRGSASSLHEDLADLLKILNAEKEDQGVVEEVMAYAETT